jgi:hypothetical protein
MLLEMLFNVSMNPLFYWIPGSVVCAQLANYDYYQHITKGEIFWRPTSILAKPSAAIMFAAIALIMVVGASLWLPQN